MKLKLPVFALVLICTLTCAQDKNPTNKENGYEVIVSDLNIPWGFTFLPDNSILITEKLGKLIHFKKGIKTEITGLPEIFAHGQGGLMDIILHPNYKDNNLVYFSYASSDDNEDGGNTTIACAKFKNNKLLDWKVLYKAKPNSNRVQHFGSRLAFDNNGHLFFSIGDRGDRDINPQDITRDCGKIYRINDDGSIPEDNPFTNISDAKKAIYSYGHRNPQGMVKHPKTGKIWTHEHGPKGGDEINIINAGKNYGWPIISYGVNYSGTKFTEITEKKGMEQPLHYWVPSIAPSGMAFINSDKYGDWNENLLVGSLRFQYLNMCTLKDGKVIKEEKLLNGLGRVRSVEQGPDGYIYVGIENLGIVKLIKK
ncbi:PQQ-dependent sugar dehydrogenase [Winogradskyella sp.]|jgi:glucose/arabinose dehydrogenase|uniref:PQQ-dependent sugar dehydrogenase n=1 Tax=Winogradskyella sp. TaxID=1883156 RepID=UPI0025D39E01|nr:PQQ-dependent sugar dehydrogenase [Winogradskyella sp.]MCT4628710.1 PQQ-dependent sugar dehydrogenase [Winogradskyella sp.]